MNENEVKILQMVMSSRFGEVTYSSEDVLFFPRGLPAFEHCHQWILAGDEDNAVKWLQSIEDGELALPVTVPDVIMPDYNAKIPEDDLDVVGAGGLVDLALLIIVSIPEFSPWEMTANLRAPILVNLKTRRATQVIVLNEEYSIRHAVFSENAKESMKNSKLIEAGN